MTAKVHLKGLGRATNRFFSSALSKENEQMSELMNMMMH